MKTKKSVRQILTGMLVFAFFIAMSGCKKNLMDDYLSPSAISDVKAMSDAYVNASTYNDSLILCTHNSSQQSNNMMASCINQQTLQHDSALCLSLRMHYDDMYHQQDSLFNYYHNLCHQQMGNLCSGNMMNGGMMSGGMMEGNSSGTNHCMINNTDHMSMMNSLHQLHKMYHP